MPDPIWIHFIQLGHATRFRQKQRELVSTSTSALVTSTSSSSASLIIPTSSMPSERVYCKNTSRAHITSYITADREQRQNRS
ncbi:18933_t:CDS:2 [Dentiscutata erythropus]|uniref:18933_t:CDS:1 n=1 Tax=Dentiscutata erythropus TaxID=1348616 RepID=A0A9N9B425_9GLOM|nr:18933_t:CDS:2 [Dentiscutata erythropus]